MTSQKTQAISYTINEELKTICPECQLIGQEISNATLECVGESPNSVIFSAVISGTAEKESRDILEELGAWIYSTSPSISVLGVVMGLGEGCSSAVSDLGDDICNRLQSSTCETPTNNTQANRGSFCNERETKSSGNLGLSVGVGIGAGLVLILVAGAVVLILFCFLKYRRSSMQSYLVKKE